MKQCILCFKLFKNVGRVCDNCVRKMEDMYGMDTAKTI